MRGGAAALALLLCWWEAATGAAVLGSKSAGGGGGGGALPPAPPLMSAYQRSLMAKLQRGAKASSDAATPSVLRALDHPTLRSTLARCCQGCYFKGSRGSHRTPWHPVQGPLDPLHTGKVPQETLSH
jgi:hypothetical protein